MSYIFKTLKEKIMKFKKNKPKKLNLGCGFDIRDGYINIDLRTDIEGVTVADITNLNFQPNTIDEILALDVFEHISHQESFKVLKHWHSLLKPGGKLVLRSPSIDVIFENYYEKTEKTKDDIIRLIEILYGKQNYETNFHYTVLHPNLINYWMKKIGFVHTYKYINQNIQITAFKKKK